MYRPQYYTWCSREHSGVAQVDRELQKRESIQLPEQILRLAHTEYQKQQGRSQDYERMQERAELSVLEVLRLLADYVERLGGEPTKPRQKVT